jgi:hypothetical protein
VHDDPGIFGHGFRALASFTTHDVLIRRPVHQLHISPTFWKSTPSFIFTTATTLQASNDLQHWVDLRRHIADAAIRLPGQYASWPVSGPASHMPFRAFRLLLAGPTLSAATPWNFCLSHVEFYGYFFGAAPEAAGGGAQAGSGGAPGCAASPLAAAGGRGGAGGSGA